MTLKQRNILNTLDVVSILFATTLLIVSLLIIKYDTNSTMRVLFVITAIISIFTIKNSITCIANKQK